MDVKAQCIALSRAIGADYAIKSRSLTYEEVFSPTGFLPVIAKRANKLAMICFGYGIGATFEKESKSSCGYKVVFDNDVPRSFCMICVADVICELVTMSTVGGRIMLDELYYESFDV